MRTTIYEKAAIWFNGLVLVLIADALLKSNIAPLSGTGLLVLIPTLLLLIGGTLLFLRRAVYTTRLK